eukprot:1161780-Pelagomonas_calceolata.AAC.3
MRGSYHERRLPRVAATMRGGYHMRGGCYERRLIYEAATMRGSYYVRRHGWRLTAELQESCCLTSTVDKDHCGVAPALLCKEV